MSCKRQKIRELSGILFAHPPQDVNIRPERDQTITIIRWLAILAVVVLHANFESRYSEEVAKEISKIQWLCGWAVLCFFSISGYLVKTSSSWIEGLWKRAKRLILPYLTVSIVSFGVMCVIQYSGVYRISVTNELQPVDFAWSLLLGGGFGPQMYFLPWLFAIGGIWDLVARILPKWTLLVIGVIILNIQCAFDFVPAGTTGPGIDRFILYFLAYGLGAFFVVKRRMQGYFIILFSCAILIAFAIAPDSIVVGQFAFILFPFVLYCVLSFCAATKKVIVLFKHCNPGAVYLWHAPILLPAASVLLFQAGISNYANFAGSCVVAVAGSLLIDRLIRLTRCGKWMTL